MKNILISVALMAISLLAFTSCDPQDSTDYKLGPIPSADQLSFTIKESASNPNILEVKNTSKIAGIAVWSFGNGASDKGDDVIGTYPFKGDYTVTLTLYTSGGAESTTQNISIAKDDYNLLDTPMYNALTGGIENTKGKTWVYDQTKDGHFGVGPADSEKPDWWSCPAEGKAECSLYTQELTFTITTSGLKLNWTNNGWVYTNGPGKDALAKLGYTNAVVPGAGDYDVEYSPKSSYTFMMVESANLLTLHDGAFVGHYTGNSTYNILKLTEDEMYLKVVSTVEPSNAWWYRFVPKNEE